MPSKHKPSPATATTVAPAPGSSWDKLTPQQKVNDAATAGFALLVVIVGWYLVYRLLKWQPKPPADTRTPEQIARQFYADNPPFLRHGEAERFRNYREDIKKDDFRSSNFGNSRYAGVGEVAAAGLFASKGIPLGSTVDLAANSLYRETGWLRYAGREHGITFGPTGSGKFTTFLAHIALTPLEVDSLFFIDPKGEIAAVSVTASHELGRRAFYLKPFNDWPGLIPAGTRYNPLEALDPLSPGFGADCNTIANLIIPEGHPGSAEGHFTAWGRAAVSGFIVFLRKYTDGEGADLVTVREIFGSSPSTFKEWVTEALATGDPLIAERLSRLAEMADDDREARSIVGTVTPQLDFIGNDAIRDSLRGGDGFTFAELREPNTRVFLILPGRYLDTCSKWFRLVTGCAIRELMENLEGASVTMILDEAAQLGYMSQLVTAMPQTRSMGLRFWPVFQDIPQIRRIYDKAADTLLSSCGIQQFFTPNDMETAKYISERCGRYTVRVRSTGSSASHSDSLNSASHSTSQSDNVSETGRPLCDTMEVMNVPRFGQYLFKAGMGYPIISRRYDYWEINALIDRADPNPYHNVKAA